MSRIFLLLSVISLPVFGGVKFTPNVDYSGSGGKALKVDIYQPAAPTGKNAKAKRPVVLCIHGGGWEAGSRKDFGKIARYFAERGYVAFCPSYRLVTNTQNKWPAQLDDVQTVVRWIRHHAKTYAIDPGRIAAIGGSAGGHLAALLGNLETRKHSDFQLQHYSSKVNAVVSIAGPTDLTKDFRKLKYTGGRTVQDVVNKLLGNQDKAFARRASPIFYANGKSVPHMLIHGAADRVVPVEQSREYKKTLIKAGVTCKYIELPNVGHSIKNPITIWLTIVRVKQFLDTQLVPR